MKKKLLAALLAAAMLMGLASATFATSTGKSTGGTGSEVVDTPITDPNPPTTVTTVVGIKHPANNNVAPGGTLQLEPEVTKSDGSKYEGTYSWSVSPADKGVTVDASGKVTVASNAVAGEYIVTMTTEAGKATIDITVTAASSGNSGSTSSGGGSSSGSTTTTTTPAEETVSTTEAVAKVEQAIAAADENVTVVVVKVRNAKSITAAALKAVAKAAEKAEKTPIVHADVVKDGKVESRLYIDPSLVKGNGEIKLGVTLGDEKVSTKFDKYFKNDIAVVKFDQAGSFGMNIKAAVKLDLSKLDTKNLVFYSYDPKTNRYTKMSVSDYRIDANGYLHFTTSVGNCVLVTDEPLARK